MLNIRCHFFAAGFGVFSAERLRRAQPKAAQRNQRVGQTAHGARLGQRQVCDSLLCDSPARHGAGYR